MTAIKEISFFEVTLRAPLQKCARKTVSWPAYPTAGRRLAAILNFRSFPLDARRPPGMLRLMMNNGAETRGDATEGERLPGSPVPVNSGEADVQANEPDRQRVDLRPYEKRVARRRGLLILAAVILLLFWLGVVLWNYPSPGQWPWERPCGVRVAVTGREEIVLNAEGVVRLRELLEQARPSWNPIVILHQERRYRVRWVETALPDGGTERWYGRSFSADASIRFSSLNPDGTYAGIGYSGGQNGAALWVQGPRGSRVLAVDWTPLELYDLLSPYHVGDTAPEPDDVPPAGTSGASLGESD